MNGLMQSLRSLGVVRLAAMAGVALAMVAFFAFLTTRLTAPTMSLLFGDLDLKDSAQIIQRLEAQNVQYQIHADGAQIMVPSDQVARLRMTMAEQDLPHGGSVGYELFDKADTFGSSSFVQTLNQLRALEGELSRTIGSLSPVLAARVHLVLPHREIFSRDQQEASASIVVKLRGAEQLSKGQTAAIEHLVAAAVPGLKPSRVSVVDSDGNLLARGDGDNGDAPAGAATADMRVDYENRLSRNVEDLLERSLGPGKVRVDVHADMDFDRVTTSTESFDPDSQVVRSTQSVSQNDDNAAGGGGDQPVTVTNNLPATPGAAAGAGAGAAATQRSKSAHTEETTNYEISKTVKSQVTEGGDVRRLSVAVLVDGIYTAKPDGTKTYEQRSPEEIKQITALVRSAIGFNEQRGDSVDVVNLRFTTPDEPTATETAGLLGFDRDDILRMAEMLVIAVIALLVILLVIRPVMFRIIEAGRSAGAREMTNLLTNQGMAPALPAPAGMSPAALANTGAVPATIAAPRSPSVEQMIDISQVDGRVAASSIRKIGEIVEKHPEEAVAIIRSWMYEGT